MKPEQREHLRNRAVEMRATGMTIQKIASELGVSKMTASRLMDLEKYEAELEKARVRQRERAKLIKSIDPLPMADETRRRRAELEALMDAIPQDTRSKTARFAGDPLPGRSALDRLRAATNTQADNVIQFRRAS